MTSELSDSLSCPLDTAKLRLGLQDSSVVEMESGLPSEAHASVHLNGAFADCPHSKWNGMNQAGKEDLEVLAIHLSQINDSR